MKILFWDTEINNFKQNRLIQLAWDLVDTDDENKSISKRSLLVKPYGWTVDEDGFHKGRFTNAQLEAEGHALPGVLKHFLMVMKGADLLVAHNASFDHRILKGECERMKMPVPPFKSLCTMTESKLYVGLPLAGKNGLKPPKLEELHWKLFEQPIQDAHSADADVAALKRCFVKLMTIGVLPSLDVLEIMLKEKLL